MSTPRSPNIVYDPDDAARLAFMLRLVDTLQSMPDAVAIEEVVCRLLAEHLHVEHVWFAALGQDQQEITIHSEYIRERSGSLAGVYGIGQLRSLMRLIEAGQPFILDDAATPCNIDQQEKCFYDSNRIRSCLAFPVGKGKQSLNHIAVADGVPRHWTARDVSLVHETAIRAGDAIERSGIISCGQLLQQKMEEIQRERAILMQKLDAQINRLHKLVSSIPLPAEAGR